MKRMLKVTRRLRKTDEAWTEPVWGMYEVSPNGLPKLTCACLSPKEKRGVDPKARLEDKVLDQCTRSLHYGTLKYTVKKREALGVIT